MTDGVFGRLVDDAIRKNWVSFHIGGGEGRGGGGRRYGHVGAIALFRVRPEWGGGGDSLRPKYVMARVYN